MHQAKKLWHELEQEIGEQLILMTGVLQPAAGGSVFAAGLLQLQADMKAGNVHSILKPPFLDHVIYRSLVSFDHFHQRRRRSTGCSIDL